MSRRQSDYAKAGRPALVVDWADFSPFHRNILGYRLILTKGWSLYAVDEVDGLMCVYDTENWAEWIRRIDTNLDEMFLYSDRYDPRPLFDKKTGMPVTLEQFLREFQ
jgi:hypothetical protein